MRKFLFIFVLLFVSISPVSASTYSTDTNLFDGTYPNNLIDMAQTQIDNFNNKSYLIFQNGYDYYLVSSHRDNVSVNGSRVVFTNADIIRVIRTQNGYNYVYNYSHINESSTTVNVSNIVISNIDTSFSVNSKRYDEYNFNYHIKNIAMFVLGLLLAIFLTRERSFV